LILAPAQANIKMQTPITTLPQEDTALKIGDTGIAITILRPVGKAKFGDAIADVVAEGEYIQKDKTVKIVLIQGNKIVVRET